MAGRSSTTCPIEVGAVSGRGAAQDAPIMLLASFQDGGVPVLLNTCHRQQQPQQATSTSTSPVTPLWISPVASITGSLIASITSTGSHALFASITNGSNTLRDAWSIRGRRDRGEDRPLRAGRAAAKDPQLDDEDPRAQQQMATAGPPGLEAEESDDIHDSQDSETLMPKGSRLNKRDIKVFCSTCHHNTLFDEHDDLVECSCCHRVYHKACYERHVSRTEGIDLPDARDEYDGVPWFHAKTCKKVHDNISSLITAGERPISTSGSSPQDTNARRGMFSWLPFFHNTSATTQQSPQGPSSSTQEGGFHSIQSLTPPEASWRLVRCGAQTSPASRIAMSQVYNLLRKDFGYTLGDYGSFDVAALLRKHGRPVCAAVLDVYGPDVAEVFVMATQEDVRRQGNCRLLLRQLAHSLHVAGVRRMVVSIDEDDEEAKTVWDKLGFRPLEETTLRSLRWSLPAFNPEASKGTMYLGADLKPKTGLLA